MRAIQATNPDVVAICSYPLDSVGIVKAVNEIGFKPKMIGGAMVGLQATVFKNQLGPLLNGFVNYETWVPSKEMMYEGTEDVLQEVPGPRQGRKASIRSATIWAAGAMPTSRCSATPSRAPTASRTTCSPTTSARPRSRPSTGDIKFGKNGEWAKGRMLQVQYHGIKQGDGIDVVPGHGLSDRADARRPQDRQR